jgi:hypothetical protein
VLKNWLDTRSLTKRGRQRKRKSTVTTKRTKRNAS